MIHRIILTSVVVVVMSLLPMASASPSFASTCKSQIVPELVDVSGRYTLMLQKLEGPFYRRYWNTLDFRYSSVDPFKSLCSGNYRVQIVIRSGWHNCLAAQFRTATSNIGVNGDERTYQAYCYS